MVDNGSSSPTIGALQQRRRHLIGTRESLEEEEGGLSVFNRLRGTT